MCGVARHDLMIGTFYMAWLSIDSFRHGRADGLRPSAVTYFVILPFLDFDVIFLTPESRDLKICISFILTKIRERDNSYEFVHDMTNHRDICTVKSYDAALKSFENNPPILTTSS